jgi:hypothetical protein
MLVVKTFSATKSRDRDELGDKVTRYVRAAWAAGAISIEKELRQSSDAEYHCISIVLFLEVPDRA